MFLIIVISHFYICNHGHNILRLFDTLPDFLFTTSETKAKQSMVISNKHGIYELPQELPNELRLKVLGNDERSQKSLNFI